MSIPKTVESLKRDIQAMFDLLRESGAGVSSEARQDLENYSKTLESASSSAQSVRTAESFEFEFYSLLERHSGLKGVYLAVFYMDVIKSSLNRLRYLVSLADQRVLTTQETEQKETIEAAQRECQQKINELLKVHGEDKMHH